MFILMIARGVPTPQDPQWGCFEKDQAEALAALGHKVVVASVDSRFRLRWRQIGITHHHINGVEYYDSFVIPGALTDLLSRSITINLRKWQIKNLYKVILADHGKPDVLYGQFFYNSFIALPISIKENIPLINIEHAARFNEEHINHESLSQSRTVYQFTKANIAVSDSLRISLAKLFNVNCHVVHNVYGKEFHYSPSPQSSKVRFVTTGSLIHRKGYDLLIQAFAKAQLTNEQWHLNIIGSGEEKSHLQQQIEQNNLQDNITLAGQKSKEEIVAIYQQSDIFVLPSRSETFGVVYIEAMACGLPVIATPCGGPEEFVTDKDGLLVPVDNVDKLAEAIKYMFHHYQEYNRKTIADDCKARFSSEVIAKQLTEIFEDVAAKQ